MNPEILGLTASVIILIGGMMQDEKGLRIIDSIGSVMMTIYGVLIGAPSVVFLNGALAIAHAYRIVRLTKRNSR